MQALLLLALLAQPVDTGNAIIPNTESPSPVSVAAYSNIVVPPYDTSTENTGMYCRLDHRPGETDFIYCMYMENVNQSQVGGSLIKLVNRGAGDALYVALLGSEQISAYGVEVADFGGWQNPPTNTIPKQSNLFLASLQGSGSFQESVKNQANSIGYSWLVHDDGVDPTDPDDWATNYGGFYAINSLSNAFRVRVSSFASNYPQIAISDTTLRNTWAAYGEGQLYMDGALSVNGGDDEHDSPEFKLRGTYNDGSETYRNTLMKTSVSGAGVPSFYMYTGTEGAEALRLIVDVNGLSMQNNDILDVGKITMQNGGSGLDMQTEDITNVGFLRGAGILCASLPGAGNAYTLYIVTDAAAGDKPGLCLDDGATYVIADGSNDACCP